MRLSFDSIDEVKEFVKSLKGTRGAKGEADDAPATGNAPAPLQPPANAAAAGFPGVGASFPAAAANLGNQLAPEIAALINRITVRMDGAVASGATEAEDMLTWFRGQCSGVDPSAAGATLDQIKQIFLPKLSVPALDNIAKLMSA